MKRFFAVLFAVAITASAGELKQYNETKSTLDTYWFVTPPVIGEPNINAWINYSAPVNEQNRENGNGGFLGFNPSSLTQEFPGTYRFSLLSGDRVVYLDAVNPANRGIITTPRLPEPVRENENNGGSQRPGPTEQPNHSYQPPVVIVDIPTEWGPKPDWENIDQPQHVGGPTRPPTSDCETPEPEMFVLMGAGLIGIAALRRRK